MPKPKCLKLLVIPLLYITSLGRSNKTHSCCFYLGSVYFAISGISTSGIILPFTKPNPIG